MFTIRVFGLSATNSCGLPGSKSSTRPVSIGVPFTATRPRDDGDMHVLGRVIVHRQRVAGLVEIVDGDDEPAERERQT